MMKKHDNLKGFSEFSQAERKVFSQESDGLFDDALAKAMHTAIQSSSYQKQSAIVDEHGDFFDEADVNEKFKDRPSQLASLLAKGRRTRCPVRGVELIWVPTYSLSIKKEHGDTEERKQVVQQDTTVKRKKLRRRTQVQRAIGTHVQGSTVTIHPQMCRSVMRKCNVLRRPFRYWKMQGCVQ